MATVLTRNQYENQFVDFYEQTLGTGISVVDPIEDDDTQDDGTTRSGTLAGVGGVGGEDAFNPMAGTNLATGGPSYTANNIMAGDYVRDNAKSARRSMDKSDSGFFSYMKNLTTEQFKERPGQTAVLGVASLATGFPLTTIGAVAGDLNRKKQYENAVSIVASGGGNMMNLNGQTVSRVAGSKRYTGNLMDFTSEQIYAIEELGKGFIPGTMEESLANPDDSRDGTFKTTGKEGLLDAATAERLGGNYDAYGNWHSTKYGTVSRGAPIKAAEELAKQLGVYTPNMDLVKFSNTWKAGAKPQTTTQGGFRDFLSGLFSNPLRDSTIGEYKTQRDKVIENIRGYDPGQQEDSDDGPQPDGTIFDTSGEDETGGTPSAGSGFDPDDDSGDNTGGGTSFEPSYSGGSMSDFGDYGSYEFATGGRIGMQAGGTAPAGFVQGPPGQFSEAETVADDQPMEVPEGTFVINAPAVEHAGSQDIRKMILDAYTIAREKGLDIGRVDRKLYEESVDVALSKGEVVIPPQIAKIIGYDRLRKINNRGKKEVSRRQKASEGGFLSAGYHVGGEVHDHDSMQADLGELNFEDFFDKKQTEKLAAERQAEKTQRNVDRANIAFGDMEAGFDLLNQYDWNNLLRAGLRDINLSAKTKTEDDVVYELYGAGGMYQPYSDKVYVGPTSKLTEGFATPRAQSHVFAHELMHRGAQRLENDAEFEAILKGQLSELEAFLKAGSELGTSQIRQNEEKGRRGTTLQHAYIYSVTGQALVNRGGLDESGLTALIKRNFKFMTDDQQSNFIKSAGVIDDSPKNPKRRMEFLLDPELSREQLKELATRTNQLLMENAVTKAYKKRIADRPQEATPERQEEKVLDEARQNQSATRTAALT